MLNKAMLALAAVVFVSFPAIAHHPVKSNWPVVQPESAQKIYRYVEKNAVDRFVQYGDMLSSKILVLGTPTNTLCGSTTVTNALLVKELIETSDIFLVYFEANCRMPLPEPKGYEIVINLKWSVDAKTGRILILKEPTLFTPEDTVFVDRRTLTEIARDTTEQIAQHLKQ